MLKLVSINEDTRNFLHGCPALWQLVWMFTSPLYLYITIEQFSSFTLYCQIHFGTVDQVNACQEKFVVDGHDCVDTGRDFGTWLPTGSFLLVLLISLPASRTFTSINPQVLVQIMK